MVERQAEADLERFKAFIEAEGYATGAWRGSVNEGGPAGTPDVDDAAASRGDSGKAGVSGKVAAGVGLAAAAVTAVAATRGSSDEEPRPTGPDVVPAAVPPPPVEAVVVTDTTEAAADVPVASDTVLDLDDAVERDAATNRDGSRGTR